MQAIQIISQDLFDKVRSRFSNLEMGDETGAVTIDPAEARFFDFDFVLEGNNLGRVSISLNDLGSLKVYYSVENNSVGEAALVAINELGEESIPGLFLSEPIRKGHVRRYRKGFYTTHSSKISVCAKLKHLIESNRMTINSKPLISELKTYVAKGLGFEGKSGTHDDLVSSILLAVRMSMVLQDWDPAIYDKMREESEDEWVMPMPVYVNTF